MLRTLLKLEIAAREVANRRIRLKQAGFPVTKTLEAFNVAESSIPRPTFEYISSLDWVDAKENLLLIGPPGTGKSHALVGCGVRAVERGKKIRYLVAADLIETLYRGLADNTVGKVISHLLLQRVDPDRRAGLRSTRRHRFPAAVSVRRRCVRASQPGPGESLAV